MDNGKKLGYVFDRYKNGLLSEGEVRDLLNELCMDDNVNEVEDLILQNLQKELMNEELDNATLTQMIDTSFSRIKVHIERGSGTVWQIYRKWLPYVAAIIIVFVLGGVYVWRDIESYAVSKVNPETAILPGRFSATLSLSDGRQIRLDSSMNGALAEETGVKITVDEEGQLVYSIGNVSQNAAAVNRLSTQNGESYRVRLPDGTQVWLNSASSIRYAVNFNKNDQRRIDLEGEAYFDVAPDKSRPFVVYSNNQKVQVLGTRFNINSYSDEPRVTTTLVEGKVKLSTAKYTVDLVPGQEAILAESGQVNIMEVDPEIRIAWVKNEFVFDNQDIQSVMRMVARWYNLEVKYKGEGTTEKFSGVISRFDNVEVLLQTLEKTGAVRFKLDGRKIYVQ